MEGSTNTFQYRPLSQDEPEIRLVSLLPASDPSAEIHCELLYTSLDEPDLYEPLSYAWGDPTITELIFLDDHKFAITTNFCSALKHLRLADQPRTLWIDSICIDQLNITERNYQVQHMRPIYEDAPRTLVWLGEEGDAGEAINFLVEMDNLMWGSGVVDNLAPDQPSAIGVRRVQNQRGKEAVTKLCDSLTMPEELRRTARALDRCQDLFDRRWFKRSWVMQEVFHTKFVIFYIGKISLSFRRLEDLWQTFTICIQILLRILKQVKDDAGIPASYLGSECMFLYGDLDAGIPLITAGRDHQYSYWVGNWKLKIGDSLSRLLESISVDEFKQDYWELLDTDDSPLNVKSHVVRGEIFEQVGTLLSLFRTHFSKTRERYYRHAGHGGDGQAVEKDVALGRIGELLRNFYETFSALFPKFEAQNTSVLPSRIKGGPRGGLDKPLSGLLCSLRHQKATDARDKIYSLLGMTDACSHVHVDYCADQYTLYKQVSRWCLDNEDSLILCHAESIEDPRTSRGSLPSWSPDWSTPTTYNALAATMLSYSARAGGNPVLFKRLMEWDGDILVLKGVVIGEVVKVSVVDMAATMGTSKKGEEPGKCVKLMHILPETFSSGLRSGAIPFVLAPVKNKECIDSTSWCPWWTKVGDIIIVVPGVSLPLVVSKVPESNDWWLLGSCRLIDSTLKTKESHVMVVKRDQGYSPIMYGSTMRLGDPECKLYTFRIR